MSDNIPFEIQVEIIKRIPDVKSLIQFQLVSKSWMYVISSPMFIADYKSNQHRILIRFQKDIWVDYVSVVDDDTFPQHNFPLVLPSSVSRSLPCIIGSSQGLFCFYNNHRKLAVIWNPCIRKSVTVDVPTVSLSTRSFGVCPRTNDPKLLMITAVFDSPTRNSISKYKVEIFTLRWRAWRSLSMPLEIDDDYFGSWEHEVVIDGIIYWHASADIVGSYNRIITFDLTSEKFGEVCLPDNLAARFYEKLSICKLNESLVVVDYYDDEGMKPVCDVWMMENGYSFKKLYTIKPQVFASDFSIWGFRMNGELIIKTLDNPNKKRMFKVYDPCNNQINDLDLRLRSFVDHHLIFESSYTETLLLLDQFTLTPQKSKSISVYRYIFMFYEILKGWFSWFEAWVQSFKQWKWRMF